jgi:Cupin-like domain
MSRSFLAAWTPDQYRALEHEILLAPHRLHESGLFDDENLIRMLDRHPLRDLGINTMGESATRFEWREGDRNGVPSDVLLDLVRRGRLWINMRKLVLHHADCRAAIDAMYDELEWKSPGFKALQRTANLLISSPGALVHYHLDVPVNMLWHIRGEKRVWVYPLDRRFVSQQYIEGVCAGEYSEDLPYDESFDQHARVFDVRPGQMLTWPQNTPHRVTNLQGMNVSLSTEHTNQRALRQLNVHAANQFLRRTCGLPRRSTSVDGPTAHMKQALSRVVRRFNKLKRKPPTMGNQYPVTFKVDPAAPLGFSLLDAALEHEARAEPVGV